MIDTKPIIPNIECFIIHTHSSIIAGPAYTVLLSNCEKAFIDCTCTKLAPISTGTNTGPLDLVIASYFRF